MKNSIIIISAVLLLAFGCAQPAPSPAEDTKPTTLIIVRHAEKVLENPDDKDPLLTSEGMERAERLAQLLSRTSIDAIFATQYQRNQLTVLPTATQKGLEVLPYNSKERHEIIDRLLEEYQGKTVLVSAHSNSSPELVNILTGGNLSHLDESDYNNIYIVTASAKGNGKVVNLYY